MEGEDGERERKGVVTYISRNVDGTAHDDDLLDTKEGLGVSGRS